MPDETKKPEKPKQPKKRSRPGAYLVMPRDPARFRAILDELRAKWGGVRPLTITAAFEESVERAYYAEFGHSDPHPTPTEEV